MKGSHTASTPNPTSFVWVSKEIDMTNAIAISYSSPSKKSFAPLQPIRQWLDEVEVRDAKTAHKICQLIPAQCPFERTLTLFGRPVLHIPPMCKLNPFYEQVVALRFRALCYLADTCGEDISQYC